MTLGFAVANWEQDHEPVVAIVADSRFSNNSDPLSDSGIKTYELGGRSAMVAAGSALLALTAAEIIRSIVENHNRRNVKALGFYDTVRLLCFFLRRATRDGPPSWTCKVAVSGFLESGRPCLAYVIVSPDRNRVRFWSIDENQKLIIPVGAPNATSFLLQGFAAAREQGLPPITSGISLLWYISNHKGAFPSVGGGLSFGSCARCDQHFSWPHLEIEGRRFLRGIDITDSVRPGWPSAEVVNYDESWCEQLDRRLHQNLEPVQNCIPEVLGGGYEIDSLSTAETLFQTHNDPAAFDNGLARNG